MKNRIITSLIIIVCIVVFISLDFFFFGLPDVGEALNGNLNKVQEKTIDVLIELTKLFITFSVTIIGALSYFIVEGEKEPTYFSKYKIVLLFICAGSSIISIYFGHLIFSNLIEMLANDFLEISGNTVLIWSIRLQYLFLLISIAILVVFVFEKKMEEGKKIP